MKLEDLAVIRVKWPLSERGASFRKLREKHGVTLVQIAERSGVSKQTVSNFEIGKNEPRLELEGKMTDALTDILAERRTPNGQTSKVYGKGLTKIRDASKPTDTTPEHAAETAFYLRAGKLLAELDGANPADLHRISSTAAEELGKLAYAAPESVRGELSEAAKAYLRVAAKLTSFEQRLLAEDPALLQERSEAMYLRAGQLYEQAATEPDSAARESLIKRAQACVNSSEADERRAEELRTVTQEMK